MGSQEIMRSLIVKEIQPGLASLIIVIAELLGTSLWFSINSVSNDLMSTWKINVAGIGFLTNSVQLGFVIGTVLFAFSGIADRYRPSQLFAICTASGAIFNTLFALWADNLFWGAFYRLLVGFCLAGIYPIGMKLIITWEPEKASQRLAQLVGMLTLGTALPHGTRYLGVDWSWQSVILTSSACALLAMTLIFWLGDGPHLKTNAHTPIALTRVRHLFSIPQYRNAAFGYFGHMWELYAFWALVPFLLAQTQGFIDSLELSAWSFGVIAMGSLGCFIGGQLSTYWGNKMVASLALGLSAACCLIYPWINKSPLIVQIIFWVIWGMSVVADSPQFSALSSKACPPEKVGTALTIQNALGFTITMISIQVTTLLAPLLDRYISWILLPGPILGLLLLNRRR